MAEFGSGPIARAFVIVNRVFGVFVVVGGIAILADFLLALARGESLGYAWPIGVAALVCVVVGIVYLRAPLWRVVVGKKKAGDDA